MYREMTQSGGEGRDVGDPLRHPLSSLARRVEITRTARFAAAKRLGRMHTRSYYGISLMSLYVIVLSVLPNVVTMGELDRQFLLLITIVCSVYIIITTIMDGAEKHLVDEMHMKDSARKLGSILNRIIVAKGNGGLNADALTRLHKEYDEILASCPADHSDVDFLVAATKMPNLVYGKARSEFTRSEEFMHWGRVMRVHYVRSRWLIPHLVVVIVSVAMLYFRLSP